MRQIVILGIALCVLGGAVDVRAQTFELRTKKGTTICADFGVIPAVDSVSFRSQIRFDSLTVMSVDTLGIGLFTPYRLVLYVVSDTRIDFAAVLSGGNGAGFSASLFSYHGKITVSGGRFTSVKGRELSIFPDSDGRECLKFRKWVSTRQVSALRGPMETSDLDNLLQSQSLRKHHEDVEYLDALESAIEVQNILLEQIALIGEDGPLPK